MHSLALRLELQGFRCIRQRFRSTHLHDCSQGIPLRLYKDKQYAVRHKRGIYHFIYVFEGFYQAY